MASSEVMLQPMPVEKYRVIFVRGKKCCLCLKVCKLTEFNKSMISRDGLQNRCEYCQKLCKVEGLCSEAE